MLNIQFDGGSGCRVPPQIGKLEGGDPTMLDSGPTTIDTLPLWVVLSEKV